MQGDPGIRFSRRDEALLEACDWLSRHPENADGADKTRALEIVRALEQAFGRVSWPPESLIPSSQWQKWS
jgi:hypothetical protein